MMFSVSHNDRRRRINDHVAASGIGNNSAEIGDGAAGFVDMAEDMIPC